MRARKNREGTIGIALAAMLATAACGGRVDGGAGGDEQTTTPDDPTTTFPPPNPPPTSTVAPPTPPPPSFDRTSCGEAGGRMSSKDFCGSATRQVPCDVALDAGAVLDNATCRSLCLSDPSECDGAAAQNGGNCSRIACSVQATAEGSELRCFDACPGGRRPGGYGGERAVASTSLGRAFARLAQLESVSIPAFGRLADELGRHGLSPDLAARARQAQRDEVRHARDTWRLARRFGASLARLEKMPRPRERTLLELALENAEEGCVREAYGSVVSAHQAERATDPEIRRVMETIAHDEAAHAALAWAIHDELMTKLSARERALVAHAFERAWTDLAGEVARAETDELLRDEAGLPDGASALAGLRALEGAVRERLATAA